MSGFTSAQIQMYANVGGQIIDIVDFQCTYTINKIPKAVATIPVGREVKTLLASRSHILSTATQIQIPTNIYVNISYGAGATNTVLPVGTYLIFAGWTTGIGYRHSYGGLQMSLEVTHWLSALTFSSTLLEGTHPQNPAQFTHNYRVRLRPEDRGHLFPDTLGSDFFAPDDVTEDLWGKCILPFFNFLTTGRRLDQDVVGGDKNDSLGGDCANALALFQGDELPLDIGDVPADEVASAIGRHVCWRTMQPTSDLQALTALAQTTVWSKLVGEMAPSLGFAVIPFAHKASVVPFVPGLQSHWAPRSDFTFMARDLDSNEMNMNLIRPLRAWGFSVGHGGRWGDVTQAEAWDAARMGGWYVGRDDGLIVIKQALPWLAEFADLSAFTNLTAGIAADGIRADGFNFPAEGTPPEKAAVKEVRKRQLTLLDKLAHAGYVTEMLRNRVGRISGPFRFDVCPGSTVKIEGTAGNFLGGLDPHGEPKFATVLQVSYVISAQQSKATTVFDLVHLRTETENGNEDTSVERHPLYDRVWTGDYMLQEL